MKCSKCKSRDIVCRLIVNEMYINTPKKDNILLIDYFFYCTECKRNKMIGTRSDEPNEDKIIFELHKKFDFDSMRKDWFFVNITPIRYLPRTDEVNAFHNSIYPGSGF